MVAQTDSKKLKQALKDAHGEHLRTRRLLRPLSLANGFRQGKVLQLAETLHEQRELLHDIFVE